MKTNNIVLAFAAALAALPAIAAQIVPAQPTAFEPVNLRMTVDSCAFRPETVRVRHDGHGFVVTHDVNQCLQAGPPEVVDIRLGSLPAGQYRVEVYRPRIGLDPVHTVRFDVSERAEVAVFPPPPRPLTDYTGMWWNPQESGWGLALHQGPVSDAIFGAWFVYGASGEPEWFTLQGGRWTSATRWTGPVYRTTGPFFAGPDYDSRLVLVQAAGHAVLDFRQAPGEEGRARFTYTVGNATTTKVISRMAF